MRLLYFAYSAAFREHTQSEVSLNYINEQISRFNCMLEKYSELVNCGHGTVIRKPIVLVPEVLK